MPAATATVATVATVPRPPRPIFLHTDQHRSVWAQRHDLWSTGWLGSRSQPNFWTFPACQPLLTGYARKGQAGNGKGRAKPDGAQQDWRQTWGITRRSLLGRVGAHLDGLEGGRREVCAEGVLTSAGSELREVAGRGLGRRA